MTNTPESDTMKTLTELAQENGGVKALYVAGFDVKTEKSDIRESICFNTEAQLLSTFNAWSAQQAKSYASDRVVGLVEKILSDVMDIAVSNGANSVSMPDEYVELAMWVHDINKSRTNLVKDKPL